MWNVTIWYQFHDRLTILTKGNIISKKGQPKQLPNLRCVETLQTNLIRFRKPLLRSGHFLTVSPRISTTSWRCGSTLVYGSVTVSTTRRDDARLGRVLRNWRETADCDDVTLTSDLSLELIDQVLRLSAVFSNNNVCLKTMEKLYLPEFSRF